MRGASRRQKKPISRFRHDRVAVEADSGAIRVSAAPEDDEAEKIEVHVHVHRSKKKARLKRPRPRQALTGVLFDWKGHYDQVCKPLPSSPVGRWARLTRCLSCSTPLGLRAQSCPRCGAPRSRRAWTRLMAALGLGAVAIVFVVCVRLLGSHDVAEVKSLKPLGEWSDDEGPDIQIVEVPIPSSPFLAPPAPPSSPGGTQTQ